MNDTVRNAYIKKGKEVFVMKYMDRQGNKMEIETNQDKILEKIYQSRKCESISGIFFIHFLGDSA